jgi:hypothetical protein
MRAATNVMTLLGASYMHRGIYLTGMFDIIPEDRNSQEHIDTTLHWCGAGNQNLLNFRPVDGKEDIAPFATHNKPRCTRFQPLDSRLGVYETINTTRSCSPLHPTPPPIHTHTYCIYAPQCSWWANNTLDLCSHRWTALYNKTKFSMVRLPYSGYFTPPLVLA